MATFNPITITNAGEEILAQAVAGDGTLTFTAVSSSSDKESGDLKNITELQNVRQTVAPVIAILEDNIIQLSAVFSNSGLEQGYVVNTLGIYAKIGSEAPVLFAIATATDPDTVPGQNPISPSNFYYQFNIAITDDSNITVSVPEEGSLPASVFYQKFGSANISQIGDGTVTGAIIQNANVAGGDKYDSAKSYAAGDYFIYNDQLCKVLTAIASGAELTPGNNYQVTSLENEISGLNGKLGELSYVDVSISQSESGGLQGAIQKLLQRGDIPRGEVFIAKLTCGSIYSCIGHFYENDYGEVLVLGYEGIHYIRLQDGIWSEKIIA